MSDPSTLWADFLREKSNLANSEKYLAEMQAKVAEQKAKVDQLAGQMRALLGLSEPAAPTPAAPISIDQKKARRE
jgi:uncharacterized coiled-coil protein SlyX